MRPKGTIFFRNSWLEGVCKNGDNLNGRGARNWDQLNGWGPCNEVLNTRGIEVKP